MPRDRARRGLSVLMMVALLYAMASTSSWAASERPEQVPPIRQVKVPKPGTDTTLRTPRHNGHGEGRWLEAAWRFGDDYVLVPERANGWSILAPHPLERVEYRLVGAIPVSGVSSGSTVTYAGALPDADLILSIEPFRYKAVLRLHRPPSQPVWRFDVRTRELEIRQEGEVVQFLDDERVELEIKDLVARDAIGSEVPVRVALRENGNNQFIELSVDPDWLSRAAYPVDVDPTTIAAGLAQTLQYASPALIDGPRGLALTTGRHIYESWDGFGEYWDQAVEITDVRDTMAIIPDDYYSNDLYVLYNYTTAGGVRLRFRVLTPNDSGGWDIGPAKEVASTDYKQTYALALAFDSTQRRVLMTYGVAVGSTSQSYYHYFRSYDIQTGSLSTAKTIDSVSSTTTYKKPPIDMDLYHNYVTNEVYFVWSDLVSNSSGIKPLQFRKATGSGYTLGSAVSIGTATVAARTAFNLVWDEPVLRTAAAAGGKLYYYQYNAATGAKSSTTLASTGVLGSDRPAAAVFDRYTTNWDVPSDLYVLFVDTNYDLWYVRWSNSTQTWTSPTLMEAGTLRYPNSYFTFWSRGAYFIWWDETNSSNKLVQFGGRAVPYLQSVSPANNSWVSTTTPRFSWVIQDRAPDAQTAYRVEIFSSSGTLLRDSGKVASSNQYYDVPTGVLIAGNTYKCRVTVWDTDDMWDTSGLRVFSVDTTAPTASLAINNGNAYTTTLAVKLNITASDTLSGLQDMRFTYNGTTTAWEPFASTKDWNLTSSNGTHSVTAEVRDKAGLIEAVTDTIILDTTRPVTMLTVAGGAASTPDMAVTLSIDSANNPQQIRFRNESTTIWSAWEPYVISKAWTLTAGWGDRTVYTEVSDLNGTTSTATDAISLTFEPPTDLQAQEEDSSILLQWTASVSDATVGYNVYRSSTGGSGYTKMNANLVTGTSYRDSAVVIGNRYYYYARSVDSEGRESPNPSNEVTNVAGTYPVGTLTVTEGSTSGPGGLLSLTARSESAVKWNGIEWRPQGAASWNLQAGSGTVIPGVAFEVTWTVPTLPNTYEVRVKLEDDEYRLGQTNAVVLTLPNPVLSVDGGTLANIQATWTGGGTYDLVRSSDPSFANGATETLLLQTTATSWNEHFNGLYNGSFELGAGSAGPQGWVAEGAYSLDSAVARWGTTSLYFNLAATSDRGVLQEVFSGPGLAGRPVTVSTWMKVSSVSSSAGGAAIRVDFLDRANTVLRSTSSTALTGTADWQQVAVTEWAPANTWRVQVWVGLRQAAGGLWVDGVQIEAALTATGTYSSGQQGDTTYYYRLVAWNGPLYNTVTAETATRKFPDTIGTWPN